MVLVSSRQKDFCSRKTSHVVMVVLKEALDLAGTMGSAALNFLKVSVSRKKSVTRPARE